MRMTIRLAAVAGIVCSLAGVNVLRAADNDQAVQLTLQALGKSSGQPAAAGAQVRAVPFWMPAPAAGTAGVALASATIGYSASGVPCFGCLPGFTIGLPVPMAFITGGSSVTSTVIFGDASYTGACTAAYGIVKNGALVNFGTLPITNGCQPNYVYYVAFNSTLPTTPGAATLVGVLTAGGQKSTMAVTFTIQ